MQKVVFGFAGEISSGKGTASAYLKDRHKASVYTFSGPLRDIADRIHQPQTRENLQKLSTMLREGFFDNLLSEIIYKDILQDDNQIISIDGVRRPADIEYLKKIDGFRLVYIEADLEKRFERIKNRQQNVDDQGKTFEEFKRDHEREAERKIKSLKEKADFVLENNGSFEDFYRQLEEMLKKVKEGD